MPFDPRKYLTLMMYTIFAILICTYVFGNENGDLSEKTYPVENVKVIDGPFNGFTGTIEKVNEDKRKLEVMVKIFGRKTPLELSYMQVEKL